MRRTLRTLLACCVTLLACAAARAQAQSPAAQRESCAAAWARLEPDFRGRELITLEKHRQMVEAAKEYLRLCDCEATDEIRYVRRWVETVEVRERADKAVNTYSELFLEVRKGDAPAETYGRLADAAVGAFYEPRKHHLHQWIDEGRTIDSKEVRDAWAGVTKSLDTIIAAYARAIALCGEREGCRLAKGSWTAKVTKYYVMRHDGSTEGLQETLARGLDAPIPFP